MAKLKKHLALSLSGTRRKRHSSNQVQFHYYYKIEMEIIQEGCQVILDNAQQ